MIQNLEFLNAEEDDKSTTSHKENISTSKSGLSDYESRHRTNSEIELKIDLESDTVNSTVAFYKHINKYFNVYIDFDQHYEEYIYYIEFNWSDHAYYILQNLNKKGIEAFDSELKFISTLTTNSIGNASGQLNTFLIRHSISCYIEKILGFYHEEYDYSNTNKLIQIPFKRFIKNIACYPQKLTNSDFENMNLAFNNEEIMHVILLVASVKSRLQLTYLASKIHEIIKTRD